MTIEDALKKTFDIRISHDDKWLVWDDEEKFYVIYQYKQRSRKTQVLFMVSDFEMALAELIKKE